MGSISVNQQYYKDQEDLYLKNKWKSGDNDGEYSDFIYSLDVLYVPQGVKLSEEEVCKILSDLIAQMDQTRMGHIFLHRRSHAEILGEGMLNNEYSQEEMDQFQHAKCARVYLIEMIKDLRTGSGKVCIQEVDDDEQLKEDLMEFFWNNREEVEKFVRAIHGARPKQITALTRQLVILHIVDESCSKQPFYQVMVAHHRYPCSKSNWNMQVKI